LEASFCRNPCDVALHSGYCRRGNLPTDALDKLRAWAIAGLRTSLLGPFLFHRLQVVFRQFNRLLAPAPSPAIAFDAADKTLTVVSISLKQIKIAKDRLLIVEIITQPRGDEPAEAREIRG
jgi:hypothetical protein